MQLTFWVLIVAGTVQESEMNFRFDQTVEKAKQMINLPSTFVRHHWNAASFYEEAALLYFADVLISPILVAPF